jgi:hypothetical protein
MVRYLITTTVYGTLGPRTAIGYLTSFSFIKSSVMDPDPELFALADPE